MGAASTLSSIKVYHIEPDGKGQPANLAGQHQKKIATEYPQPCWYELSYSHYINACMKK